MLSGSEELLAGSMPLADRDMLPDDCRGSQSAWLCRPVDAPQSSWVKIQEESTSHPEKGSHAYACQQAVRVQLGAVALGRRGECFALPGPAPEA